MVRSSPQEALKVRGLTRERPVRMHRVRLLVGGRLVGVQKRGEVDSSWLEIRRLPGLENLWRV